MRALYLVLKLQEGESRDCSWTVTVKEVRQTVGQIQVVTGIVVNKL